MKKLAKLFLLVLVFALMASVLVACGEDKTTTDEPSTPTDTSETPTEQTGKEEQSEPTKPSTPDTPDTPSEPEEPTVTPEEPTHIHAFGEWKVITNPTCMVKGLKKRICKCGEEETEEIKALGHDIIHHEGKEPTCTEIGYKAYDTCSRCDYTTYEEIEAKGHTEVIDEAVEPSCTETGLTEGKHCSVCKEILVAQEVAPALGHDIIQHEGKEPTCTEIGYKAYDTCSRCDYTTYEEIAPLGHNYVDGVCTRCGAELTETEGLVFSLKEDDTYEVTGYEETASEVFIMSIHEGKAVTSIGSSAFYNCSNLTSITIPDSVTSIGYDAFGYDAFYSHSLTSVYYTGDIASWCGITFSNYSSNPLYYAHNLYIDNELIKDIVIPDTVTEIKARAFNGWNGTSITIPDSVTSIRDSAFSYCSSLTSITIPDSVTSIGNYAFEDCYHLVEVYNKSSLNIKKGSSSDYGSVGYYAKVIYTKPYVSKLYTDENGYILYVDGEEVSLIGYEGKDTELTLPAGITEINRCAFYNNKSVRNIMIPDSVTSIGYSAFSGCTATIVWGNNPTITTIGSAFSGYNGTSITIPDSVTSIGYRAFYGCTATIVWGKNPAITTIGTYAFSGYNGTSITIPDSVTSIGYQAFLNCSSLTSITIGNSVTSIEEAAFSGITGLTSITIPDSVTSIGEGAFHGCSNLTSITIPDSVTSIGECAFEGCFSLTSVYYTGDIASWCGIAFSGYYNDSNPLYYAHNLYIDEELVTELVIPDSVTSIGYRAFDGCSSLTSITISDSVTSIGECAFNGCSGLTIVTIGAGVKSIGDHAFYGCYKLVEVYNKASLDIRKGHSYTGYVGYYAKAIYTKPYVSKLSTDEDGYILYTDGEEVSLMGYTGNDTELTLPAGITEIYQYAFYENTSVRNITIPDSVTSIGNYAFYKCTGLTSVTIGDSVTSIGDSAFSGCYKLVEVYNKSSLNITKGSSDYGSVGYYAKVIYTKPYVSKLYTDENGYILYVDGEEVSLIGYIGNDSELTLPAGITEINQRAFYNNKSVRNIMIPDSVTSIGSVAFYNCSRLTSITIPDSVTSIGGYEFYWCSSLTSITFQGTKAQWSAISKGSDWNFNTGRYTVYCTNGTISK